MRWKEGMNSRQRFLTTISGGIPDRPPLFANFTPQVAAKISDCLGLEYEPPLDSVTSTRISHSRVLTELGNDCVGIASCAPDSTPTATSEEGLLVNEWGMHFKPFGLYNEFF